MASGIETPEDREPPRYKRYRSGPQLPWRPRDGGSPADQLRALREAPPRAPSRPQLPGPCPAALSASGGAEVAGGRAARLAWQSARWYAHSLIRNDQLPAARD